MFKKKNKPEASKPSVQLDIGLSDVGIKSEKKSSKVLKIVSVIALVLIISVGSLVAMASKQRQIAPDTETPTTNEVVGVDDSTEVDEVTEEPEEIEWSEEQTEVEDGSTNSVGATETLNEGGSTTVSESTNQFGVIVPSIIVPKEYVAYTNNFVNVQFVYPEKWYITEQTHMSLETLKEIAGGQKVSLREQGVTKTILSNTLKSPNSGKAVLTVSIHPVSNATKDKSTGKEVTEFEEKNGLFVLTDMTGELGKDVAKEDKVLGANNVSSYKYQITEYSELVKGYQVSLVVGNNRYIFNLLDRGTESYDYNINIVDNIVKSFNIF